MAERVNLYLLAMDTPWPQIAFAAAINGMGARIQHHDNPVLAGCALVSTTEALKDLAEEDAQRIATDLNRFLAAYNEANEATFHKAFEAVRAAREVYIRADKLQRDALDLGQRIETSGQACEKAYSELDALWREMKGAEDE